MKYEETHQHRKSLELRIARVIYRVGQITYRAITNNKWDQVIVTMHALELKMNNTYKNINSKSIKKGKIQEFTDLRDYF
jgi:hypothetical protein